MKKIAYVIGAISGIMLGLGGLQLESTLIFIAGMGIFASSFLKLIVARWGGR